MAPRIILLALIGLLAGCGTNVPWLIERSGDLTRQGDWLVAAADGERAAAVYDAEAARLAACADIDPAVMRRFEGPSATFGEQFLSDLALLAVLIVLVGSVERCAEAQRRYQAAVEDLEGRIGRPNVASGDTP